MNTAAAAVPFAGYRSRVPESISGAGGVRALVGGNDAPGDAVLHYNLAWRLPLARRTGPTECYGRRHATEAGGVEVSRQQLRTGRSRVGRAKSGATVRRDFF